MSNSNQLRMDYSAVFSTPEGKRVLEDILATCHILELEPDTDPTNIVARAHRRDVAHHILIRLGYGPAQFPKLIEEISDAI